MQSWVAEELKYTQLPDKRLNQRLAKIVEQAFAKPEARVPQASSNWTDTKATYDFWKSERLDYEDILVRFSSVTIMAPTSQKHRKESVKLNVITAVEENPVAGEKAINWLLLTTLPVNNWQEAVTCLRWYTYRWLIKRYHYVLKSRCGVEKLQLEKGDRIKKALATYAIVAWRLLWLLYYNRDNSEECCETIFNQDEWQSLYCYIHNDTNFPEKPPTIKKIIIWIASLGGFLARKNDREAGVKCLGRGIRRLSDITQTWMLAKSLSGKVCET